MTAGFVSSRITKLLNTWSPSRLRKKLKEVAEEREQHAFSVRQLIAQRARLFEMIEFVGRLSNFKDGGGDVAPVVNQVRRTESQFYQDIVGLLISKGRRGGFFVEFGACDGVRISNTFILEKEFGWTGILAEPDRAWHADLMKNRGCFLETQCVWSETGKRIPFYEAQGNHLESSADAGSLQTNRRQSYEVETISLYDLLKKYNAPHFIDFMSVDVEGTEFNILESFPFGEYEFGLMCIEHHQPEEEAKIKALMQANGYRQVFRSISNYDGWYVPEQTCV